MKTINNSSEIYKQIVVSDDTLLSTSDYINDKVNDVYNQMLEKAISDFLRNCLILSCFIFFIFTNF